MNPRWPHFICIDDENALKIERILISNGSNIWRVEGAGISSAADFLVQADSSLPHQTGLSCGQSWDAFDDWLWSELSLIQHQGVNEVGIFWRDAHHLIQNGKLQDFLLIVQTLCEVFVRIEMINIKVYLIINSSFLEIMNCP